jgi:hypothetical protein
MKMNRKTLKIRWGLSSNTMIQETDNVLSSVYSYSDPDLDTNKVINQKYFYSDNEISLDILNLFEINLFKKSGILLGGGKEKVTEIFSRVIILKKKLIKNSIKKKSNFNCNKKITSNDLNNIVSGGNKSIKNFSLSYKIEILTRNHPKFIDIIVDNKDDCSLIIGNLTTSNNNSVLLSEKGELYTNKVYMYNQISIEKLNDKNINDLEEVINDNKDVLYTEKIQSLEECSYNMNKFIENKTNQKIFLKNEQVTIEEKIQRIKNYKDEIDRINSRED